VRGAAGNGGPYRDIIISGGFGAARASDGDVGIIILPYMILPHSYLTQSIMKRVASAYITIGLVTVFLLIAVPWPRGTAVPQDRKALSGTAKGTPTRSAELEKACTEASRSLQQRLGDECAYLVRAPFVIAGDLPQAELADWHRRTIAPAARAIASAYTSVPPDEPITILLFAREKSYRHYAEQLYGDREVSVYGYYKPTSRTMLMNIATGGGTLVHELTHALVDFDFPDIPDWFNEGLASLHEQCRFRADESGIDGLVNWRLPALQKAIAEGRLRPLEELIGADDFRGRLEGLNYAHARYFCLYMQEQGVLGRFYRAFRDGREKDKLGLQTALAMFPERSWTKLNTDFRRWAVELQRE
jgi:hypothetical protein